MKILGLCGYAKVGKDTAAQVLSPTWKRYAFADALKSDIFDLPPFTELNSTDPKTKEKMRDLLVAYGAAARAFNPSCWVDRLKLKVNSLHSDKVVVTDVRYVNEVEWIRLRGGTAIYIERPGYGPVNEEEDASIKAIKMLFHLPVLRNDSTISVLQNVIRNIADAVLEET